MKKGIKIFGAVILVLMMLGMYDFYFFTYALGNCYKTVWISFTFLNVLLLAAVVLMVVFRRMHRSPLLSILPSTYLLILTVIETALGFILTLLDSDKVKILFILHGILAGIFIISFLVLTTANRMERNKTKKSDSKSVDFEKKEKDVNIPQEESVSKEEPRREELIKVQSSVMLLLMKFVTDIKDWENLSDMPFLDDLLETLTRCTQYTYKEILPYENDIKIQVNALKTYTTNNSIERAEAIAEQIVGMLNKREDMIREHEKNEI
ncbi:MAG: hypothetical protein E7260_09665 [Lachnospiraceae bacterium]|nr:hypothetical protein [Lachnospiraceae bacterium]